MNVKKPPRKSKYLLGKAARFISQRFLLKPALKIKFTPNQITTLSLACCILSALFYSFASNIFNLFALLFFILFMVLDHLDGDLARCLGRETVTGELFDSIAGKLAFILAYLGICLGQAKLYNVGFIWLLGFIIMAGFFGFQSLIFKRQLLELKNNPQANKPNPNQMQTDKIGILRTIIREITDVYMGICYLIIIGSILNKLYYTLILSSIYVWLYYFYESIKAMAAFSKIHRGQS
ncbi:MAG: CDP-alcohol phosphatidyltransferase family protein [Candidatus Omnitrophota bacterium]|nr:CDP-alcohol phosphatidyltransferase family protein [Candidatus Omnitrophota bacterium]